MKALNGDSPPNALRVAICGLGSAARRAHVPALRRAQDAGMTTLVGACDPDPGRGELVPAASFFGDVFSLLEGSTPDLLVIASPPSAHLEAIAAAAEQGIDVLCEKPLGVAPGDIDVLRGIVGRHPDVLIGTVHQYRHAAAWAEISSNLHSANGNGGFHLGVRVERPGTDPLSAGGWRARVDSEGGILGDHAVHYLALCWGLRPEARVTACRRHGSPGRESASVELVLDGATACIDVTYSGAARHNCIEARLAGGQLIKWADARLTTTGNGPPRDVGALSDRGFVNDLYGDLYSEMLAHYTEPAWRSATTEETIGVAALLSNCLALAAAG
jgi:predicted dehydrogenase